MKFPVTIVCRTNTSFWLFLGGTVTIPLFLQDFILCLKQNKNKTKPNTTLICLLGYSVSKKKKKKGNKIPEQDNGFDTLFIEFFFIWDVMLFTLCNFHTFSSPLQVFLADVGFLFKLLLSPCWLILDGLILLNLALIWTPALKWRSVPRNKQSERKNRLLLHWNRDLRTASMKRTIKEKISNSYYPKNIYHLVCVLQWILVC